MLKGKKTKNATEFLMAVTAMQFAGGLKRRKNENTTYYE